MPVIVMFTQECEHVRCTDPFFIVIMIVLRIEEGKNRKKALVVLLYVFVRVNKNAKSNKI